MTIFNRKIWHFCVSITLPVKALENMLYDMEKLSFYIPVDWELHVNIVTFNHNSENIELKKFNF